MRYPRKGVIQIAEIANGIMDPLLSKRAGINTALLGSWDEIAGDDFADCTRPEKITRRVATRVRIAAVTSRAC